MNCSIFLSAFNQIWSFSADFHEVSNIKFHESQSRPAALILWTDMGRDVAKLIGAFRYLCERTYADEAVAVF
jgi:hypothetical protein